MLSITKRFEFCCAHRLVEHEGLCANWHGHNYILEITVISGPVNVTPVFTMQNGPLDAVGRIVDFSVLKKYFYGWIKEHWDHAVLINENDPEYKLHSFPRCFLLPYNPTAENMVLFLRGTFDLIISDAGLSMSLQKIRLYETSDSWAEWSK
jgi:6-pyruvoyltetrahydropterin/6-carboxytetrahydropterin synthase